MSKEITQQPFTGDQPRSSDDTQLVDQVLGREAAAEMEELLEQDKPPETEPTPLATEIGLSEDELGAVGEAEKSEAEKCRQEYYVWAKKIGKDNDWVDNVFTFNSDGTVIAEGDVNLRSLKIDTMLPKLISIAGYLDLTNSQITSLKGLPNTIGGDLKLSEIPATSIPEGLHITGVIYVYSNQTKLIRDCKAKGYKNIVLL